jgi:hypothetical protein
LHTAGFFGNLADDQIEMRLKAAGESAMGTKTTQFGLAFVSILSVALIALAPDASAKTISVSGSGTSTYVTVAFSFDGKANAVSGVSTGSDNVGGTFVGQSVTEYAVTATSCVAPDKTTGTVYDVVQNRGVKTYKKGQIFTSAVGASDGTLCASNTTSSENGTVTATIFGGSGSYAKATGTETTTFTSELLGDGTTDGGSGDFGATQFTLSGSVKP